MPESPVNPSMRARDPPPLHVDTGVRSASCAGTQLSHPHAEDTLDPGSTIPSPGPTDYLPLSPMNTFFPPVLPPATEGLPADTLPPLHEVFASTTFFPSASEPLGAQPRPIAGLPSTHIPAHPLPPPDLAHAHASKSAPFPFTFKARIPQHPHAVPQRDPPHVRVLEPPGDPFYTHRFRARFPPPQGQLEWGWTPRPIGLMRRWAWGRQENGNYARVSGLSVGSAAAQVQVHADELPPYAAFVPQAPAQPYPQWQSTATVHALHPLQMYSGPDPEPVYHPHVEVDTEEASFVRRFPPLESIHSIRPSVHPTRPAPAVSTAVADRSSALVYPTAARTSSASPPHLVGAPSARLGHAPSPSPSGNAPSPRLGFRASLSRLLGLRPSPPRQAPAMQYDHPFRNGNVVRKRPPGRSKAKAKEKATAEKEARQGSEVEGDEASESGAHTSPPPPARTHRSATLPPPYTPQPQPPGTTSYLPESAMWHTSTFSAPGLAPAPASASASISTSISSSGPPMLPLSPVPFSRRNVRRRLDPRKERVWAGEEDDGVEDDEDRDSEAGSA